MERVIKATVGDEITLYVTGKLKIVKAENGRVRMILEWTDPFSVVSAQKSTTIPNNPIEHMPNRA